MPRPANTSRVTTSSLPMDSFCKGTDSRPTLLWIDDFEPGLTLYRAMFESFGFRVLTAGSGREGVRLAETNSVDVVVTDYEMPGMDGLAVARAIKRLDSQIPVIIFSGSTLLPRRAHTFVDAACDKAGPRSQILDVVHRSLQRKRSQTLQPPPLALASHLGQRTVA